MSSTATAMSTVDPVESPDVDEWLDSAQLARELRMAESTLRVMRVRGEGPAFFKFGPRTVRYHRGDVDRWVASCRSAR